MGLGGHFFTTLCCTVFCTNVIVCQTYKVHAYICLSELNLFSIYLRRICTMIAVFQAGVVVVDGGAPFRLNGHLFLIFLLLDIKSA